METDTPTLRNQSAVRAVLRNELTWIIFTVGLIWGAVTTIILPIQKLQIQTAQIQEQLVNEAKKYDGIITTVNDLEKREQKTATILDEHLKLK